LNVKLSNIENSSVANLKAAQDLYESAKNDINGIKSAVSLRSGLGR